jgi:release factor glutamine methyltransferase
MAETWTIGRLLNWTKDYLEKQGSSSPRLDAEVLLAYCKQCPRIALYTAFDEIASDELRNKFRDLVKKRADGMPVAYLVGKREFYSLNFAVTPAVLIPRPETEFLVVRALDMLKQFNAQGVLQPQVVDIGTGSGCIAVTVAKHAPTVQVTAIDQSTAALEIAKKNAEAHQVAARISFAEGDLLGTYGSEPRWHLILSNPPYISEPEFAELDKTVRDFEPRSALVGGPAGTEIIERLLPQVAEQLLPGGVFLCEISPMILPAVEKLVSAHPAFAWQPPIKDIAQLPRVIEVHKIVS